MMYCRLKKTYRSGKRSFSIDVEASFKLNAINVLYGHSGAGKTSLLRLLSGLDTVDFGKISVNNKNWLNTETKSFLPIHEREIAYVFQDYGLFPNMTVLENLEFAKKNINQTLLKEIVDVLELEVLLAIKPNHLSGGQQQRVALARAIIQEPKFLFLDEPLSAIDENLRGKLQSYLIALQQKHGFTIIMVSHNLHEVLKIANHVCVLHEGKIEKEGNPKILLKENNDNTLRGVVLDIKNELITVLTGTQLVNVYKKQVVTKAYQLGSDIKIKL
ncbi:ATP-binding cassette domain-containing protein [Wenyingzhuangia sp. IMCC45467]